MAVVRNNSVRPVVNMSAPKNGSFNSNVNEYKLEKVYMSTALHFGYAVVEAGRNAVMSKFDLQKAYKIMPTRLDELRLQGFKWLGKVFFEKQGIFGAISAVCNFDRFGNTSKTIACYKSGTPQRWVFRILDDVPIVAPAGSGICERFSKMYVETCENLGVALAPPCKNKEKSFVNVTSGTVLGIVFDTTDLTWHLPKNKADDLLETIFNAIETKVLSLEATQKLVGSLNYFAQLCPFAKLFRFNVNSMIPRFMGDKEIVLAVPTQGIADLQVFLRIVESARLKLPIPVRPGKPSLCRTVFTSDAAGANFVMQNGVRKNFNRPGDRGVASVSFDGFDCVFACILRWPLSLLNEARDSKLAYYGSKSTTLEMVGLLLPFLTAPSLVAGKHVVLEVDNAAIWHGWAARGVRGDVSASILIRALYLISYYLGSTVHVKHVPRKSTWASALADALSRESSTGRHHWAAISDAALQPEAPVILLDWLASPSEDWDLALSLLSHVQSTINFK